ncbi:MAG: hypothetical protein F6K30_25595 [Cyanothece sp. SIO2G6]|nr:hypothetical protein [Cyanothece sp. SIO2G6]
MVVIHVGNVNRAPQMVALDRNVALGETLRATLTATDVDWGTTLTYSAENLPEGATLDAQTGELMWQPGPGQVGEYVVTDRVSDGEATVTDNALIRVTMAPIVPVVTVDLTPSFPAVPDQTVLVRAVADSVSAIESISVTVNGEAVAVDELGRVDVTPDLPGRYEFVAQVVDRDRRVGTQTSVLKVKDPADQAAPAVAFAPELGLAAVTELTEIRGRVSDINLDEWTLEVATLGAEDGGQRTEDGRLRTEEYH